MAATCGKYAPVTISFFFFFFESRLFVPFVQVSVCLLVCLFVSAERACRLFRNVLSAMLLKCGDFNGAWRIHVCAASDHFLQNANRLCFNSIPVTCLISSMERLSSD